MFIQNSRTHELQKIWYLYFWDRLSSHAIIFSFHISFPANDITSFPFMPEKNASVHTHHIFFIHSSAGGHPGWCHTQLLWVNTDVPHLCDGLEAHLDYMAELVLVYLRHPSDWTILLSNRHCIRLSFPWRPQLHWLSFTLLRTATVLTAMME